VIYTHPKVTIAGVVGAPDERSGGERVIAFVVPRADETIDAAEISAHCVYRGWSVTSARLKCTCSPDYR
jgi:long-chain acyl-CoA synthetase